MARKRRYEDVALIFEGGAMRAAYTCAMVGALLDAGIGLAKAYGTSAGAMLAACYVSHDPKRSKATFVDSVNIADAGGAKAFFEGKGYFNLQLIFEGMSEMHAMDDDEWTFHFDRFKEDPAGFHVEAFDRDSGETKTWEKADIHTLTDLMVRLEASCAYPLFVDPAEVDGRVYVDGGMGTSHDICIDAAMADGFDRFLVICSQPRGYRMPEISLAKRVTYKAVYHKYPKLYDAILERPDEYNKTLERVEQLESEGRAYVFYPDTMPITYDTIDGEKLQGAYELGAKQCKRDLPAIMDWLEGKSRSDGR